MADEHGPFCALCGECYSCMVKADPTYDRECVAQDAEGNIDHRGRHVWNKATLAAWKAAHADESSDTTP